MCSYITRNCWFICISGYSICSYIKRKCMCSYITGKCKSYYIKGNLRLVALWGTIYVVT
jgi:hypothetical protein